MTAWAAPFVGVPFKSDGLTLEGCHCWGLVRLVLKAHAGVEVPSYGDMDAGRLASVARTIAADCESDVWLNVLPTAARALDVVLMSGDYREGERRRRGAIHCGIMVSSWQVLHVEENTDSVIVPIEHARIKPRLLGFYRHRATL